MYTIKTLNSISPLGLAELDASLFRVDDGAEDPDAVLVRSADMLSCTFNPSLACIGRAGAGTNNIPTDRCAAAGIPVFNSPGGNAEAVKELALCALLLASRDIAGGMAWVKTIADQGDAVPALVEKGKKKFVGPEIGGKTLGIVGLGAIGRKLANAAAALGMRIVGYDPFLSLEAAVSLPQGLRLVTDLDDLYRLSDYISLHLPLNKDTRGMVNAASLAKMKPGVRIINIARGELVNDDDMLAALAEGMAARYVTDFPNGKTANAEKVVAIPHLGASTPESEDVCAAMAAREVSDYLLNGNIVNAVNMPALSLDRTGAARICVFAEAGSEAALGVPAALTAVGASVKASATRTRGGIAYTIADLEAPLTDVSAVSALAGVIRFRCI